MRQRAEPSSATAPHSGAGSRARLLPRPAVGMAVFSVACYSVAPYLGLSSFDVDPRIAEVWPVGGVGFVLLTVVWQAGRRAVQACLAFMVAVYLGTALLLAYPLLTASWLAVLGAAQSLLMVAMYRRTLARRTGSDRGWAPESPDELAGLLTAAVVSSIALGLLCGYPHLSPDQIPTKVMLWWVVRSTVFCFVGAAPLMVLFHGRRSQVLPASSWVNRAGLVAVAAVCVVGTYHDDSLPLSWLLIVPSVWGGLTLTVRGGAVLSLTVALEAAVLTYLPQNQFGYAGLMPAASIVDLLVIASTAFTLLLTLLREQRGVLIGELDRRRAESESQRRMLETVFDSMNDGVVILDDGVVSMYNPAARQLLARPLPVGRPTSWSDSLGLRTSDGHPLAEETLQESLLAVTDDPGPASSLEVVTGEGSAARTLDLSAKAIGTVERRSTMILLHDVTTQRARLRELNNFAGTVAHDLRGPLTVLDGWLEILNDGQAVHGADRSSAAVKARDASTRMRQVIDDWLNYAVVQNGEPCPAPVALQQVVQEIVEGRDATWAHPEEAWFTLDLEHVVRADPGLLRQLMDNLVGNAIKYTAHDQTPRIRITSRPDEEPGWVQVDVSDAGIGVPAGEEELIFREFYRGPVEGRETGTGLGLALTRRIVTLHGGRMTARRNPEGGSTFAFTLPEA